VSKSVAIQQGREFHFSYDDFCNIRDRVYKLCGINLGDHKQQLVYSRLARRIRKLGLQSFASYISYLEQNPEELSEFTNALTTNLTHFFREKHHFEFLKEVVFKHWLKDHAGDKKIRIWSAGCSTGKEPYSIAICLEEETFFNRSWDIKILATDLDTNVLAKGNSGIYGYDKVENVVSDERMKWFERIGNNEVKVKERLKKYIYFKQLNLMDSPWPMKGTFETIFCRNVVIYFDKPTQQKLFSRYLDYLSPRGYLFLGHSESLGEMGRYFRALGRTVYQKR